MTRQEFERFRLRVESELFVSKATTPFSIGIARSEFEKQKLERLIAAARTCNAATVQHKLAVYERQLQRTEQSQQRFEKLRAELRNVKIALRRTRASVADTSAPLKRTLQQPPNLGTPSPALRVSMTPK